ncbi:MAG: hypothetical protein VB112_03050 [Oscillospiraceae bacterium]|nr:hypothetical protein [Oscillospiraceae bacterium]
MVTGYNRGHPIIYLNGEWVYSDNLVPIKNEERPCVRCGRMPTPEGYDACLGYIPGVTSACCGHGVEPGYLIKEETAAIKQPLPEKINIS